MGYASCQAASAGPPVHLAGSIGAGTGATVGKLLGLAAQMKGGLGAAVVEARPGLLVGALMAVNCLGNVVDPDTGQVLAGARRVPGPGFVGMEEALKNMAGWPAGPESTVIGVVATNGRLSKEAANKVAQMAHDGLARAVRPAHTMGDGDTIFALATGRGPATDVNLIGAFAAEVTARAIVNAVEEATSLAGVPARRDL
jgi:L-aminopeptidase/D-esterase-like protein